MVPKGWRHHLSGARKPYWNLSTATDILFTEEKIIHLAARNIEGRTFIQV
jgi:hypothetical protein